MKLKIILFIGMLMTCFSSYAISMLPIYISNSGSSGIPLKDLISLFIVCNIIMFLIIFIRSIIWFIKQYKIMKENKKNKYRYNDENRDIHILDMCSGLVWI